MNETKQQYMPQNHTFVICAYGENPYLRESVNSIMNQEVLGNVLISTATPNKFIESIALEYDIPLTVNTDAQTAAKNWNNGYNAANTEFVTIVHQDDIYHSDFLKKILETVNRYPARDVVLLFTDYCELRGTEVIDDYKMLRIKRIMNLPFKYPFLNRSNFIQKRILAFGDSICCPSVTVNKRLAGPSVFSEEIICSFDYLTWINLASSFGRFVYVPFNLLTRRIHKDSGITEFNDNGIRRKDDQMIFDLLWPKPLGAVVSKIYSLAEKENKI